MAGGCEACGWLAAVGSMLAFGSFGVPIKSDIVTSLDVDPLVFQTYKTAMCFITSWLVLLMGQEFTFTPWGIVSGFFWVPGGVATVFAIKSAGLAVGIGVGSSFIVLVSFVWGIFIFQESVRSKGGACVAVTLMILGIIGMSHYSAPIDEEYSVGQTSDEDDGLSSTSSGQGLNVSTPEDSLDVITSAYDDQFNDEDEDDGSSHEDHDSTSADVVICGQKLSRRNLGILAAVFNGTWGGSIMVPMHWSGGGTSGIGYVISFAVGATVITAMLWVLRYAFLLQRCRSYQAAFHALPSLHFRKIWRQGCISGVLWSIGNFFSVISVNYLGEGVGYSVIQAAMLISGLWGICYFREITKAAVVIKWFLSASLTVSGILLLSYEHL